MANVSSSNGIEKYPKLRFPEFTDLWKCICIGDVYAERSERGADGAELLSVTMTEGVKRRSDIEGKDNSSEDKGNYKVVCAGDMVYNSMRMWQGANGISSFDGIVSPAYTVMTAKQEIANGFFAALFKTHRLISEFARHSQGMTSDTWNLKYPQIQTIKTYIPALEEQMKIADFLVVLDVRIEKQAQLVECLKKYKRGVIKSLLDPKKNTRQGVMWTTEKIGKLGSFTKGAALSKADISETGTPFILYGELYTTYKEVVRTVVRTTSATVDNVYFSRIGDVVIPTSGETPEEISTASCVMVPNVILAGDLNIFRSTNVDGRIMSYLLNHIVNDQIARVAQGKSVVHIQASEIGKIAITYPDSNEQKRIAEILELIDSRITVLEKTMLHMQNMKKGLLQQLFI